MRTIFSHKMATNDETERCERGSKDQIAALPFFIPGNGKRPEQCEEERGSKGGWKSTIMIFALFASIYDVGGRVTSVSSVGEMRQ